LKPTSPHIEAGKRIEPPMSEPVARVEVPPANEAPEPPDEPPGVMSVFQGLRVTPNSRLRVFQSEQNSGQVVRA
jgi:hypothetical protein